MCLYCCKQSQHTKSGVAATAEAARTELRARPSTLDRTDAELNHAGYTTVVLTCISLASQILLDFFEGGSNDGLGFLLCSHYWGCWCRAHPICPVALARVLLVVTSLAWNLCSADN